MHDFTVKVKMLISSHEQIKIELDSFNKFFKDVDTPFMRRTKVRVIFSCVEAQISHAKQLALLLSMGKNIFTAEELLALKDLESYVAEQEMLGRGLHEYDSKTI